MKKQKGITLIALIITIIVMLILVGVSVSVALNGGLFKTAKEAAEKTKLAIQEETGLKYEYEIAKATGEFTGDYDEYVLQEKCGLKEGDWVTYKGTDLKFEVKGINEKGQLELFEIDEYSSKIYFTYSELLDCEFDYYLKQDDLEQINEIVQKYFEDNKKDDFMVGCRTWSFADVEEILENIVENGYTEELLGVTSTLDMKFENDTFYCKFPNAGEDFSMDGWNGKTWKAAPAPGITSMTYYEDGVKKVLDSNNPGPVESVLTLMEWSLIISDEYRYGEFGYSIPRRGLWTSDVIVPETFVSRVVSNPVLEIKQSNDMLFCVFDPGSAAISTKKLSGEDGVLPVYSYNLDNLPEFSKFTPSPS